MKSKLILTSSEVEDLSVCVDCAFQECFDCPRNKAKQKLKEAARNERNETIAYWIDNADSYICSACGYESNNPNKEKHGAYVCPNCRAEMNIQHIVSRGK